LFRTGFCASRLLGRVQHPLDVLSARAEVASAGDPGSAKVGIAESAERFRASVSRRGTMSRRRFRFALVATLTLGLAVVSLAVAAGNDHGKKNGNRFSAVLTGHREVPAVHTAGQGRVALTLNDNNTLSYELTYGGLNAAATASHVHFGQPFATGGVSFFLCGGGGKPPCPPGTSSTATVTGTITAADVMPVPTQGLAATDFAAIVKEINAGFGYANVHTTQSPAGEIRGQLNGKDHDDHD
jgi:CHRD domain-containing protein